VPTPAEVGDQDAFAELRRVSQQHRVAMAELAVALVHLVCGPDGGGGMTGRRTDADVRAAAAVAVTPLCTPVIVAVRSVSGVHRRPRRWVMNWVRVLCSARMRAALSVAAVWVRWVRMFRTCWWASPCSAACPTSRA